MTKNKKTEQSIDIVEFRFLHPNWVMTSIDFENKNWSKLDPDLFMMSYYKILNENLYEPFDYLNPKEKRTSSLNDAVSQKNRERILSLKPTQTIETNDAAMIRWVNWQGGPGFHLDDEKTYLILDSSVKKIGFRDNKYYSYNQENSSWENSFLKPGPNETYFYEEYEYQNLPLGNPMKNHFELLGGLRKIYLLQEQKSNYPSYALTGFSDEFDTWFEDGTYTLGKLKNKFEKAKAKNEKQR
ncbi:MAG: hypothetical protein KC516_00775 [Nanoarchaeota archaeon]|nr:hypothetical protein [Nanoarchaeota archaeon]